MDLISRMLHAFAEHCEQIDAAHADRLATVLAVMARIEVKLDVLIAKDASMNERISAMSTTLDTGLASLDTTVESLGDVITSATVLMDGIAGFIAEAVKKDAAAAGLAPEQLAHVTQLVSTIGTMKDKLAASVAKNTPSDPAASTDDPSSAGASSTDPAAPGQAPSAPVAATGTVQPVGATATTDPSAGATTDPATGTTTASATATTGDAPAAEIDPATGQPKPPAQ